MQCPPPAGTTIPRQGPGTRSRAAIRSTFAAHIDVGWAVCKEWRGCGHQPEPKHHGCRPDTPPKDPPPPCPAGGWGLVATDGSWWWWLASDAAATPKRRLECLVRDATNRLLLCKYVLTGRLWCMHRVCGNWRVPNFYRAQDATSSRSATYAESHPTLAARHSPLMDPDLDLDLRSRRSTYVLACRLALSALQV